MKSSNFKNFYEIISREECSAVTRTDCSNTHESKSYMKNSETYYVAINTWLCLLKEVSPRCATGVADLIRRKGLLPVIKLADDVADQVVHGNLKSHQGNVFDYLLQDVGLVNQSELDSIKTILFVLRFLKRISPTAMDSIRDQSIEKFLTINSDHGKRYRKNGDRTSPDKQRGINIQLPRPHIIKRAQMIADEILTLLPDGFDVWLYNHDFVYRPFWTRYTGGGAYKRIGVKGDLCYCHIPGFESLDRLIPDGANFVCEYNFSELDHHALRNDRVLHHLTGFLKQFGRFSNGSSSEGLTTQAEKILNLRKYLNALNGMNTFPLHNSLVMSAVKPLHAKKVCKVRSVPKSFKANRIIAMEPSFNTYLAHAWLSFVELAINNGQYKDRLVLNDQTHNQFLAWQGSWKHDYCTRDLSGASDSISKTLGYQILPRKATWIMDLLRATSMDVNGRLISNNIFGTSGFTLTFAYESVIFLSLETAATEYCEDFTPSWSIDEDIPECGKRYRNKVNFYKNLTSSKTEGQSRLYLEPRTYGDDMESDCSINDYIDEVLRDYGFVINETKSYTGDHPYRESCGEEFWAGYCVSSAKWPRHEFGNLCNPTAEELSSLIQLEHKIFEHFEAREFLIAWIKSKSDITESRPYSEYSDLWVDYPELKTVRGPFKAAGSIKLVKKPGFNVDKHPRCYYNKSKGCPHGIYSLELYDATKDEIPDDEVHRRELHSTLITEHRRFDVEFMRDLDMWRYRQFLMNGPRPLDDWCALLGVMPTEHVALDTLFEAKSKYCNKRSIESLDIQ